MKFIMKDYSNQIYGYLTVIKFIKKEKNNYLWLVKCICGKEKLVNIHEVRQGKTLSCGCLRRKMQSERKIKPEGVAAKNNLYNIYMKTCVESRGYQFELTKDQFFYLTKQNCYYCDKPPSQIKKSKISQYIYNGIDRVDNSKGYLIDNVVSCCKQCNSSKSGVTKEIVFKVYEFLRKKDA